MFSKSTTSSSSSSSSRRDMLEQGRINSGTNRALPALKIPNHPVLSQEEIFADAVDLFETDPGVRLFQVKEKLNSLSEQIKQRLRSTLARLIEMKHASYSQNFRRVMTSFVKMNNTTVILLILAHESIEKLVLIDEMLCKKVSECKLNKGIHFTLMGNIEGKWFYKISSAEPETRHEEILLSPNAIFDVSQNLERLLELCSGSYSDQQLILSAYRMVSDNSDAALFRSVSEIIKKQPEEGKLKLTDTWVDNIIKKYPEISQEFQNALSAAKGSRKESSLAVIASFSTERLKELDQLICEKSKNCGSDQIVVLNLVVEQKDAFIEVKLVTLPNQVNNDAPKQEMSVSSENQKEEKEDKKEAKEEKPGTDSASSKTQKLFQLPPPTAKQAGDGSTLPYARL